MPSIELIYDHGCPNVEDTRERLRAALARLNLPLRWHEWDRADPGSPSHARRYGSPTVLVDGRDVAGIEPADEPSCRIYSGTPGRNRGVPPLELILQSLAGKGLRRIPGGMMSLLPAIGAAALPKLTCPACWPAYAGLLGALGLGFVDYTPWLLPLTLAFLGLTLGTLAWRAGARRGYAPLVLGIVASVLLAVGKFALDSDAALWTGVGLLVAASIWNGWPRPAASGCPACCGHDTTP